MMDQIITQFEYPLSLFKPDPLRSVEGPKDVVREDLMQPSIFSRCDDQPSVAPLTIGIVFSGGPAPGGHDVLCGILNHLRDEDQLIGFCNGPGGLLRSDHKLIKKDDIHLIEGLGGFDFLGTDRTKISSNEQFQIVKTVIESLKITTLIIVGGDDSNTNALFLSDALFGVCDVIGVPKTIDGDLAYPPYLSLTFGFHTATQHYARLVQQLAVDAVGTQKYWHVVKLMGRSASHVVLEVAHQVNPNACLLAEEIADKAWGFLDVISYFSSIIYDRYQAGKPYGVMVFPEGMMEVVPEFKAFLSGDLAPINDCLASIGAMPLLPETIVVDAHGNPNMSMVHSEKMIQMAILAYLEHKYKGDVAVQLVPHFFGYTGRSDDPTPFDSSYSLLLGKTAYELALSKVSGVIVGCDFSNNGVVPLGIPLFSLLHFDSERSRYVIQKALVSVDDDDYQEYQRLKAAWVMADSGFPRPQLFDCPYQFLLKNGAVAI